MENTNYEVIRVKKLKLNQDKETAKVVLDVKVDGKIGKLTIPKLNISSINLSDFMSQDYTVREIKANMLVDIESDGSAFTIKLR